MWSFTHTLIHFLSIKLFIANLFIHFCFAALQHLESKQGPVTKTASLTALTSAFVLYKQLSWSDTVKYNATESFYGDPMSPHISSLTVLFW